MSSGPTVRMLYFVGLTLGVSACADASARGDALEEAAPLAQTASADLGAGLDRNGTYRVATYRAGFPKGEHYGEVTVYYPLDRTDPLPGVVFCPDLALPQNAIAAWGPFFASHGIVLATMDTVTPDARLPERARGVAEVLTSLKAEHNRDGSPLFGRLSKDRYGLAGWSLGASAAWTAAVGDPAVKTVVSLGALDATVGAKTAEGAKVPSLIISAANLSAASEPSLNTYEAIPESTPKLLYAMTDQSDRGFGSPRAKTAVLGRYVMAWEKTFLEGDARYKAILLERGPNAGTWRTNLTP